MADINVNQPPFQPIAVQPPRFEGAAGSARPTVFDGGPQPRAWESLLPPAPSMADQIRFQESQLKLQTQRQALQGQNALAQLYRDPNNFDQNGALKPEAIRSLGAAGFPGQALEVMGTQAEIQQRQIATKTAQQKFLNEEQSRLVQNFEPLVGEYDDNVKKVGPEQAQRIGQQHYTELVEQAKASGTYSPTLMGQISPQFDPERLRRTAMGLEKAQAYKFAGNEEARKGAAEGRAGLESNRKGEDKPQYAQYVNADGTPGRGMVTYNTDMKQWRDQNEKPVKDVKPLPTDAVDYKTRYVVPVDDGKGGKKEVDAVFDPTRPAGSKYVDPNSEQPITNIVGTPRQKSPADVEDEESERATAHLIAQYKRQPDVGMASRSPRSARIQKYVLQENPAWDQGHWIDASATRRAFDAVGQTSPGGRVDAINTAIQHLGIFDELAKALDNPSNVQAINAVVNYARTELGHTEATNFDLAKGIIADEVVKSVVGSGAVFDRAGMEGKLKSSSSSEQLEGQSRYIKKLMAGAMGSLMKRWTSHHLSAEEFAERMLPDTLDALKNDLPASERKALGLGGAGTSSSSSGASPELRPPVPTGQENRNTPAAPQQAAPAAPQQGAANAPPANTLKEGEPTRYRDGQVWTLRNGVPVQLAPATGSAQ